MAQHSSLTPERWSAFSLDQQILMIANEMNRAGKLVLPGDRERRRSAYERVLNLTDLTVMVQPGRNFRRELLRWRDLAAILYCDEGPRTRDHGEALAALLMLTPVAAQQIDRM